MHLTAMHPAAASKRICRRKHYDIIINTHLVDRHYFVEFDHSTYYPVIK